MVETIYGADGFFCGPPGDWNIDGTVNTARTKLTELSEFRTKEIFWIFSKQAVRALTVPSQHFVSQSSEKAGSEYFHSLPCLLSTSETRHTLNPQVLGGFWLSLSSSLVPGMQNQMPAVTKGKLTLDSGNALMLLTNFKRQGWGHTRHMLATALWPASLQGVLQSSHMDRDISLFFLWGETLLQTAWLIHLHYLILLQFFYYYLLQRRAIPSWYLCPQLLGAYGTCKQFSLCVKWNKTRSVMAGRTRVRAVSFLSAAIFDVLLRGCQTKNSVSYTTGFT